MATVTEKRITPANLSEDTRKVRDPLQRLRFYIRTYVITEALTLLILCLAVFFWVGLALDYGSFKALGIDWVKDMPRWLRAFLTATGLVLVGYFVELGKSLRLRLGRDQHNKAPINSWLAQNPWALGAIFGGFVVLFYAGWVVLALMRDADNLEGWMVGLTFTVILVAFTAAIVGKRLLYEFRDVSLALVLEKRFPKVLGDRLITAVELHDTKKAAKYGYSQAMVEQTIHEAAERVERLNLRDVFDWKRLSVVGVLALALTAGAYALTLGGMMAADAAQGKDIDFGQNFVDLNDASTIWMERNVLLDNERWPTRSLLLLVEVNGKPAKIETKIGRGADGKDIVRADLKARAIEFAFHDSSVPESWRAATVADVKSLGVSAGGFDDSTLIDELKLSLNSKQVSTASARSAIKELIDNVEERTSKSSMSRTLRKLTLPGDVTVRYATEDGQTKSEVTMKARDNNEYTATVDGLTLSIDYNIVAEDFRSDTYRITLVPPPRVSQMNSIEAHPAYLYHLAERTGDAGITVSTVGLLASPGGAALLTTATALNPERPADDDRLYLRHRKQQRKPVRVDVQGSIKPRIEPPVGADVTLACVTSKDLQRGTVKLEGKGSPILRTITPVETGVRTFQVTIPNVRTNLDFRFEFIDTDGAPGFQEMEIAPRVDEPPDIRQFKPEVVRQSGNKFLITPNAVIPFSFDITDDAGISSLDFVYSISETPSTGAASERGARVVAGIAQTIGSPYAPLTSLYTNTRLVPLALEDRRERIEGRMPVAHFLQLFNQQRRFAWKDTLPALDVPRQLNREMLKNYSAKTLDQLDPFLTDHDKAIEDVPFLKGMDVGLIRRNDGGVSVGLKARDWEIQRQYDMEVKLEVRDTNIERSERGRRTAPAGVPLQFSIVSEAELLYEIGQEEKRLYDELFRSYSDLKKASGQMQGIRFDLPPAPTPGKPISFDSFSVRVEEVEKLLKEGQRILTKVHVDYDRVLRELRTNRISNREYVGNVKDGIVKPLKQILDGDFLILDGGERARSGYPHVVGAADRLRKTLDGNAPEGQRLDDARLHAENVEKELDRLLKGLGDTLSLMQGNLTKKQALEKLIFIERRTRELLQVIEQRKQIMEDEIFGELKKKP